MTSDGGAAVDFRTRARKWLEANARPTSDAEDRPRAGIPEAKAFQAALYDAGLAGITWPKEYGGQGLTEAEQIAFNEESQGYDLPTGAFLIGIGMCGPTVRDLGTEELKRRYLPPLLRGDEIWCQLFSEPGAGSDVAGLQTRAVRDGDDWVLNGQKVWTSGAQYCDYGLIIARTDPDVPKHQGITMFIVDMHAPGVTVRPLRVMTGQSPFNEVFFSDVRVPADHLVGEINNGWQAAVVTLSHERVSIGTSVRPSANPLSFASLAAAARRTGAAEDPVIRGALAELYVRNRVLDLYSTLLKQEARQGKDPGARGSVAKLAGALLASYSAQVAAQVAGPAAVAWEPADEDAATLVQAINGTPSSGIAGGSNEIQRNIISERVIGLPKEPRVDRDIPFRELKVGTQRRER
ncbi:MAG: dehydrogenase [Streptosporangiales bacterium]|nr:dehydrogenase [Streptosporangiales bacterium]